MEKYTPRRFENTFEKDVYDFLSRELESLPENYILFGPVQVNRRQLDGIIIGEGFMVALEAKAAKGHVSMGANTPVTVRTEAGEIVEFEERHEDPYEQAEKHWKVLSSFVRDAFGETDLWVASMLVFEPGSTFDVPSRERDVSSGSSIFVALDEIPDFVKQLASQRNRSVLTDDQRAALTKAIIKGPEKLSQTEKKVFASSVPPAPVSAPRRVSTNYSPAPRNTYSAPVESRRPAPVTGPVWSYRRPWYRSFLFLLFAFVFLNPLWAVLMITDRGKGCFFRLLAMLYFAGQLLLCAGFVYLPGSLSTLMEQFDILPTVTVDFDIPVPSITFRTKTPAPTGAPTLRVEASPEPEGACTLVWVESGASDLVNKNRSMVWEEVVRNRVEGSGMTDKEFFAQVLERNPVLEADGYVFLEGKSYLLPQCE